jgi:sugar lactone lactonase YvrE
MKNRLGRTIHRAVLGILLIGIFVLVFQPNAEAMHPTYASGDLFVSLWTGQVLWFHPDGSLNRALVNTIPGKAEGMGFDADGNLYVTHYCADISICKTGNTVEKFNTNGVSLGEFGSGYHCNPESVAFDGAGRVYVGLTDCTGDVLQFDAFGILRQTFDIVSDARGATRMDLAPDGCTLFYTSQSLNVKRFNVCSNTQLSNFNTAPLPSGPAYGLRILPDGGVLVAIFDVIVRLGSDGQLLQTYDVPGEPDLWLGLDQVGDGTFWSSNYGSSKVYRFDLATGRVLASFSTGSPTSPTASVKDVLVRR